MGECARARTLRGRGGGGEGERGRAAIIVIFSILICLCVAELVMAEKFFLKLSKSFLIAKFYSTKKGYVTL